jgi:hypothetical protein
MVIGRLAFFDLAHVLIGEPASTPHQVAGRAFAETCARGWIMVALQESPARTPAHAGQRGRNKIQAIYNGNSGPITMQGLARTREKTPAQKQWVAMEKQCEEQWKQ